MTSHKARRFRAIFARYFLKIHTFSWNIDIFRNYHVIKRIWNEFSFHTVFMKRVVCFISPRQRLGNIKHTTRFMNTVWNENSFQNLYFWHSAGKHFDRPRSRRSSMTSLVTSRRWHVYRSKIDKKTGFSHVFAGLTCAWKNVKWIFTSYGIYETRCVFYIPSPKARGYKNTQLIS